MARVGGAAEPHRRFRIVRRQAAAFGIQIANQSGRLGVAGQRGAAQPGFALGRVRLDADPFQQMVAPTRLAAAVSLFRRLLVAGAGGRRILRHPQSAFGDHAQQIQRGGETLVRRAAQVFDQCGLSFGVLRVAGEHQGVAKLALWTTSRGRSFVPAVGFLLVAKFLGAGGEDIAEYGLTVGRSAFRGTTRPFGGGGKVGRRSFRSAEQACGTGLGESGRHAVQAQGGEQRLGLDIALGRRAFDPAHALGPAGGNPRAFQIGASNPVLCLGHPALGCA